jgi:hypothetical protein
MRLLRPTNQKFKVTLCLGSIFSMSACEPIVQSKGQSNAAGASSYGFAGGFSNPGKEREYRKRNIISSSAQGRLGSLNAGGLIQIETQFQKAETYQDENKSVLTADSRTVHSLKESKTELRWVKCKEQENRYFDELFEHNFAKQALWDAK